jgi:hypothetical protein
LYLREQVSQTSPILLDQVCRTLVSRLSTRNKKNIKSERLLTSQTMMRALDRRDESTTSNNNEAAAANNKATNNYTFWLVSWYYTFNTSSFVVIVYYIQNNQQQPIF